VGRQKKWLILGQDPEVLKAMAANILSWIVSTFCPHLQGRLLPSCPAEADGSSVSHNHDGNTRCVSIGRPGGLEQLRVVTLRKGVATVGYNVTHFCPPPFTPALSPSSTIIPADCVVIRNEAFSVNYADCTIRWGLYESAKKFVGWPIVPGFDVAGVVEAVGSESKFKVGDQVFGVTMFGAYSSRVIIPDVQLRPIPKGLSTSQAAALPCVSLTALYALYLAGHFPLTKTKSNNRAILIHSAAGGVGSMLVQMSKLLGLSPVVGVVGNSSKVDAAKSLGCDVVIDKSTESDLWAAVEHASPQGYATIMDANGVSTLQGSYDHLAPTGRLIVFGFHSNLPMGRAMLSPMEWIRMAKKMMSMPKFDPMDLTVENKSVLGFNLSFCADEKEQLLQLFEQICLWLNKGDICCPRVVEMEMDRIGEAHELIQSGKSIGKIVIRTGSRNAQ